MDSDRLKLSIHLVTWNGEKYLPSFFQSLKNSTVHSPQSTFFILDNASTDATAAIIAKELADFSTPHEFFRSEKNLGFAGGHNFLLKQTDADLVLLLNQDLFLEPTCIATLAEIMEKHPELSAAAPRLMRWNIEESGIRNQESGIIDSLGLKIFRSRRVADQYAGTDWEDIQKQYNNLTMQQWINVFGVSGTCPLFRLSSLRQIAFPDGSVFDESYGSYKEDVDLAWRLQSAGFIAAVVPSAVAYHARGSGQVLGVDDWSAHRNKQTQAPLIRESSYRNHLFTLIKNEAWPDLLLDWSAILWYEWKKFVYYLLFDRAVLRAWGEVWRERQSLLAKRRWIMEKRRKGVKEFREWFI